MQLDVLAFGSHPDDVELTCAGTLARAKKEGFSAGIIDLTQGELGTRGDNKIRAKEAAAAARILGCVRENLHIPDGNIELSEANRFAVIRVIRKYRPKIILIPHFAERHPDHIHTHHLCREAWYYAGLRKIRTKLDGKEQEAWRPQNYFNYMQWQEFQPTFIVDISDYFSIRLKAILAHKSQFPDPKSKEPKTLLSDVSFLDFVETRAKFYGYSIGAKYGEPFYSVEPIGVDNIFGLKMFKG